MTQGEPLEMITYGIGILPLINNLKYEIPDVTHTGYTENAIVLGMFAIIETYFNFLTCQGPGRGYHPKPSKVVLAVHTENIEAIKVFSKCHGFKVCTGAFYLGGYISNDESNINWMRECMMTWDKNIGTIRKNSGKYT